MPPKRIVDAIGNTAIDHPAFLVRTGMFLGAKALFVEQLGWVVEREAGDIEKEGWRAVFVHPRPGHVGVSIQLTEEKDHPSEPVIFSGTHLGIKVFDAAQAAQAFKEYYERAGCEVQIEAANPDGTKWFVFIPALLTFGLELVSVGRQIDLVDSSNDPRRRNGHDHI